jgi:hypothetical protein
VDNLLQELSLKTKVEKEEIIWCVLFFEFRTFRQRMKSEIQGILYQWENLLDSIKRFTIRNFG